MDDLLDLNMNDLINEERDNLHISNEELITINNWADYKNNINNKINTMWNFVLYNDFNNKEIRRLHKEIDSTEKKLKDYRMIIIDYLKIIVI